MNDIYFAENGFDRISTIAQNYDKIFVLTDNHIDRIYSSMLANLFPFCTYKIVIPVGEQNKNIETVTYIWERLLENQAGRDSLMINLGGGTVSDIGAFAASCYKRGIDFINVPTTLLAMIDASIGGKNGVNLNNLKNQIGLFSQPRFIIVNPLFLKTLEERDILSGLAEMMKYAFAADSSFLELDKHNYLSFIEKAALLKDEIVSFDVKESGLRKILNFGHTVGHALESYYVDKDDYLTHGEAVALGIYSALYLSNKYCELEYKWLEFYEKWFVENLNLLNLNDFDVDEIMKYLSHDKKNKGGVPRFVLISAPEKPLIDVEVMPSDIKDSILILKNKFSK